jgi:hypothetical protein
LTFKNFGNCNIVSKESISKICQTSEGPESGIIHNFEADLFHKVRKTHMIQKKK